MDRNRSTFDIGSRVDLFGRHCWTYGHSLGSAYAHDHRDHHHGDHNLRSAYPHVLADALTSVLAIVGLLAGRVFGWDWMDPLMGLVGAAVIARWSWGLLRESWLVLLDAVPDRHLAEEMRERLEIDGDRVSDPHLWRVGPGHNAAVVSLVSDRPAEPDHYKDRLAGLPNLSHVTVEVLRCGEGTRGAP